MPGVHATLGASGASRWMNCPGSVRLEDGLPESRSPHAAEGTAAHDLAEACLAHGHAPQEFIGSAIPVDGEEWEVDQEMTDAVQVYVEHCRPLLDDPGIVTWIEERVDLSMLAQSDDDVPHEMFGTADFTAFDRQTGLLDVVDYKHGAGVPVDATDNPQLWYYALGAVLTLLNDEPVKQVRVTVVQPRAPHDEGPIRTQTIGIMALFDWADDLIEAARRTRDPEAPLNPGSWCKFCKAAGVCPALREQAQEQAQFVFSDETEAGIETAVDSVSRLSVDDLRQIVDAAPQIRAWLDNASKLAHDMLDAGYDVPGYKLVPKRPQRRWADETQADRALSELGIVNDQRYKQTLISPAQAEKLISKEERPELEQHVEKVSSGNTLAPLSDKREAVNVTKPSAQDVFGTQSQQSQQSQE